MPWPDHRVMLSTSPLQVQFMNPLLDHNVISRRFLFEKLADGRVIRGRIRRHDAYADIGSKSRKPPAKMGTTADVIGISREQGVTEIDPSVL